MRTRYQEAKHRAAHRKHEARLERLEWERAATEDGTAFIQDLMGATNVEPGLEAGDGFFVARNVVVTEPWKQSLVRDGGRPRVKVSKRVRKCLHCGEEFKTSGRGLFCKPAHKVAHHRAKKV